MDALVMLIDRAFYRLNVRERIARAFASGDDAEVGRIIRESVKSVVEADSDFDEPDERELPDGWADAHDFDDDRRRTVSVPVRASLPVSPEQHPLIAEMSRAFSREFGGGE